MVLGIATTFAPQRPTQALPIYSRRYGIPCQTCHLIPPMLNQTGLAFQANHFNWPNNNPPAFHDGLSAEPISGLVTNFTTSGQGAETLTEFNALELFASDGITFRPGENAGLNGGYWIDYSAVTNGQRAGGLDGAFVSLPVAGNHGQLAVVAGQFAPLTYQWDAIGDLTNTHPAVFDNGIDNVTFDNSAPGVRLEYYNNRGKMTANGNYVEVGVPFNGHLNLNEYSSWYGDQGVYVHAFRRVKFTTEGVLYFAHGNNQYASLIGTQHLGRYVYLLESAGSGHDEFGDENYLSGEATYCPVSWMALTGRFDSIKGTVNSDYPTATLTLYPGKIRWLRLSAETVQQKGNRSNTVYAYLQF
jgi:hypothetical protein